MRERPLKWTESFVDRHGVRRVYFRRGKSKRVALPTTIGSVEFHEAYTAAAAGFPIEPPRPYQTRYFEQCEKLALIAFERAQARARRRGLDFEISRDWILTKLEAQKFKCALTGLRFRFRELDDSPRNPFAPFLDQITPGLGYVSNNTRIVLLAINVAIADFPGHALEEIFTAYLRHNGESHAR